MKIRELFLDIGLLRKNENCGTTSQSFGGIQSKANRNNLRQCIIESEV